MTTIRMLKTAPLRSDYYPRLFVSNLPWTVGDNELSQHFSQFGKVVDATVQYDPMTQQSRCFAFVAFMHRSSYENALNARIHLLEGRLLKIGPATRI